MSKVWCVNKSNAELPVYDDSWYVPVSQKNKIGTILKREAFVLWLGEDSGTVINFRNSSGRFIQGYLDDKFTDSALSDLTSYPYSRNPDTLYCRRNSKVYKPDGSFYTTVPAGRKLKIRTTTEFPNLAGASHPEYMIIDAYENASGSWTKIDGSYGFVDMGIISTGSGYTKIPVYGSW